MYIASTPQSSLGKRYITIGKLQKQLPSLEMKKMGMEALNLEVLYGISERTIRRMLEKKYGSIMTDDKKHMDIIYC